MSDALDEGLVQRIDARGTTGWSGTCYRYAGAHRDALSGEGARRFGGRWNPPLLFPAIYLADSTQACMVEVERAAQTASTTAEKMLEAAYRLHTIDVTDLAVLDLTTPQAREAVGLENDDIYGDDWSGCQAVGHAAWFSCTCRVSSCPRRAVWASLSLRMNNELGRANYNCDKASI